MSSTISQIFGVFSRLEALQFVIIFSPLKPKDKVPALRLLEILFVFGCTTSKNIFLLLSEKNARPLLALLKPLDLKYSSLFNEL